MEAAARDAALRALQDSMTLRRSGVGVGVGVTFTPGAGIGGISNAGNLMSPVSSSASAGPRPRVSFQDQQSRRGGGGVDVAGDIFSGSFWNPPAGSECDTTNCSDDHGTGPRSSVDSDFSVASTALTLSSGGERSSFEYQPRMTRQVQIAHNNGDSEDGFDNGGGGGAGDMEEYDEEGGYDDDQFETGSVRSDLTACGDDEDASRGVGIVLDDDLDAEGMTAARVTAPSRWSMGFVPESPTYSSSSSRSSLYTTFDYEAAAALGMTERPQ
ncbi:hypothetical protein HDU76_013959 [Blyttiomyces sp. JEL0837]|nr:hypothetical protein HDU76_013959 [Blyttiomyces sp. JEL0837]